MPQEKNDGARNPHQVRVVTDADLANPVFLKDVKTFAARLRISRRRFIDWLADGLRDVEVELIDDLGNLVEIDLEEIERDHIDLWFRDWCKKPAAHVDPRVRAESRERVRLVATVLRMIFPKESLVWGLAGFPLLGQP